MNRVLVAYFSRSGYTRRIAEEIARSIDADLEPIRDTVKRAGLFGYLRSAREAMRGTIVPLQGATKTPSGYDLVVLGTPVWAQNVSSPMRSYLATHKNELGSVAFFCTQGGSGAPKAFRAMAETCGREPVATAEFNDRDIDGSLHRESLKRFVAALTAARRAGAARPG